MQEAEEMRLSSQADDHLTTLTAYVINDWLATRVEVKEEIQPYWPFHYDMTVIDCLRMKVENCSTSFVTAKALEQLHINSIGKARFLVRVSVYWVNINDDIDNTIKTAQHVLNFRPHN